MLLKLLELWHMWATPNESGKKMTSMAPMMKMKLHTIPVQARKEASLATDIPDMYLVILQELSQLWLRVLR